MDLATTHGNQGFPTEQAHPSLGAPGNAQPKECRTSTGGVFPTNRIDRYNIAREPENEQSNGHGYPMFPPPPLSSGG